MPKPKRNSSDRQERIEWQLNQIRGSIESIAVIMLIALILAIILSVVAVLGGT